MDLTSKDMAGITGIFTGLWGRLGFISIFVCLFFGEGIVVVLTFHRKTFRLSCSQGGEESGQLNELMD